MIRKSRTWNDGTRRDDLICEECGQEINDKHDEMLDEWIEDNPEYGCVQDIWDGGVYCSKCIIGLCINLNLIETICSLNKLRCKM